MTKRILKIEVRQLVDDTPDTSHMGEYSNTPKGAYSIDRKHSLDCPVNNPQESTVVDKLGSILSYLHARSREVGNNSDDYYYWGFADAQDIIGELQDNVTACDCDEDGDWSHRELRYFNTSGNYNGSPLEDVVNYTKQDYARMESYNNGSWGYIGIDARATVEVDGVREEITSGGLWGTESDSDASYLQEIASEQVTELRSILHTLGFSKRAIATAAKLAS